MDETAARKAAEERLNSQAGFKKMVGGFLIVIVISIVIWARGGERLAGWLQTGRRLGAVNLMLGVSLCATAIWLAIA